MVGVMCVCVCMCVCVRDIALGHHHRILPPHPLAFMSRTPTHTFPLLAPAPALRRYPFEDEAHPNNLAATVTNVLAGRVRPLPGNVSRGCAELIAGLLQPRPERRSSLLVRKRVRVFMCTNLSW